MRWSIPIPQFVEDGGFDPSGFRAYLARAEELGFESAWTLEQVLGSASLISPLEAMTYAAACTDRLRLGCVVFVTPLHQPVHLAKSLASLDQLSRGRLEVGVGIGGRLRPFSAFGVDPDDGLVARFNEGVALMKTLWTEPKITFDGRFWRLDGEAMAPKPFQKPHPPLWFGGSAPDRVAPGRPARGRLLRRRVDDDGGLRRTGVDRASMSSTEHGRDPGSFRIAKRVYIAVDDDAQRARQRMAAGLVGIYGDFGRQLEPVAVTGPPDACASGLREVAEAGAEMILLNTVFDQTEQMERLAAEVITQVA